MTAELVKQISADEWERRALECEAADIMARAGRGAMHFGDLRRIEFIRLMGVPTPQPPEDDAERPVWLWKVLGHQPQWTPPQTA